VAIEIDLSKLKASWTKYDIVQVMEVIDNLETLNAFKTRKAIINEPILRAFLGIVSLQDELPEYWMKIQNYPNEKKLFAFFSVLFTHVDVIKLFATKYSTGDMRGVFVIEPGKQFTNIRSALIESGAAQSIHRRTKEVPFDFSPIYRNSAVGKLFKQLLAERISKISSEELADSDFYDICISNNFHKAISLTEEQFKLWLEGNKIAISETDFNNGFIDRIEINNFFCVEDVDVDIKSTKEVYFLGENGDGKSLILMGIYLAFNGGYITEQTDLGKTGKAVDILRKNKDIILFGVDSDGNRYLPNGRQYLHNLFAYGVHRGRYSADNPEEYGFMSLFDNNQTLMDPVQWLKDLRHKELEASNEGENSLSFMLVEARVRSLSRLIDMFHELLERHVSIEFKGGEVFFIEKGSNLTFDQLSEGYKSVLIFVCDLIYRLNKITEGRLTWDLKGVVLVDEIDLHLHPRWQRVLPRKLRKLFPNIQFIFTTHSPTIIQGASEDAIIYRVYRNAEDGKTKVSDPYYRKDLDHLMINTVLTSPLFGLNDSRMNSENDTADTSDTYLHYRINKRIEKELEAQKARGKQFIGDVEIDELIQQILSEELGEHDKD
jgi:hypothetical protein